MRKIFLAISLVVIFLSANSPVHAQDSNSQAIYIVQKGDTLGVIAIRFGVSVDSLINANKLANPNAIAAGMQLVIPGLEGINGILTTETVNIGENLLTLSLRSNLSMSTIIRLNRITSPDEVYVGSQIVIIQSKEKDLPQPVHVLEPQQTLLEVAALKNTSTWTFIDTHNLSSSQEFIPTESINMPVLANGTKQMESASCLQNVAITPLPLVQGQTTVIRVSSSSQDSVTGRLGNFPLNFNSDGDKSSVALQGIYAMTEPGLSRINIKCTRSDKLVKEISQMVLLKSGYFPDEKLLVEPNTIDPAVTKPEDDQISNLIHNVTPTKLWKTVFRQPVDQPICYRSGFGTRRSYNNGALFSFHAGIDYGVCANLNIYAPAPGIVVFSGPLAVRGNATFIDHGWGIYSGFFHQKEMKTTVGNRVETGQLVGLIGATGRVTGPHLHWEIWVNGAQVNPLAWLEKNYP